MKKLDDHDEMEFMEMPMSDLIWVRDITPPAAEAFVAQIFKQSQENPEKPIAIYIDSPGGYIDSLMTMVSALDFVHNPIVTVAMGEAASCAAVLLSHGDVRFASPYSRIMVHEATGGGVGNVHDAKNQVDELEYANDRIISLLAANCGKAPEAIEAMISHTRRDVYMSPAEAIKMGLIDHIGVPTVIKSTTYEMVVQTPAQGLRRANKNVKSPLAKKQKRGKR